MVGDEHLSSLQLPLAQSSLDSQSWPKFKVPFLSSWHVPLTQIKSTKQIETHTHAIYI